MQELLVLGLIPGTNIQITFGIWLFVMCVLASMFFSYITRRDHLIASFAVTAYLMWQARQIRA